MATPKSAVRHTPSVNCVPTLIILFLIILIASVARSLEDICSLFQYQSVSPDAPLTPSVRVAVVPSDDVSRKKSDVIPDSLYTTETSSNAAESLSQSPGEGSRNFLATGSIDPAVFGLGASDLKRGCTCFNVYPSFPLPFRQYPPRTLCTCSSVCMWDEHVALLGGGTCVTHPEHLPPDGPEMVNPIPCNRKHKWGFQIMRTETVRGFSPRSLNLTSLDVDDRWMESRDSITWRNGTTLLLRLDIGHPYHFCQRLFPIFNLLGFTFDRMLLLRDQLVMKPLTFRGGFFNIVLRAALNWVLEPATLLSGSDMRSRPRRPVLDGKLVFESHPEWTSATESSPLCFERVIFPGHLENRLYTNGFEAAQGFKDEVQKYIKVGKKWESLPRGQNPIPHILSFKRDVTRYGRGMDSNGYQTFLDISGKSGGEVREIMPSQTHFNEQFQAIQWADIIIGTHGGHMLLPSMFCKQSAIIAEIYPYHFMWLGHHATTIAHQAVHMSYMVGQVESQIERNDRNDPGTVLLCMESFRCRRHFRDLLAFVREDWENIDALMRQAMSLSKKLLVAKQDRLSGNSTFANGEGKEKKSHGEIVESWIGRRDINSTVDFERRSTFISFLRQYYPEEEAALVPLQYHSKGQI